MKKRRHIYALATSLILGSFTLSSLSGCGNTQSTTNAKIVVTGNKNGKVGEKIKLSAQVFGNINEPTILWESLDVSIATVDQTGEVTLVSEGTALIQASIEGHEEIKSSVITMACYGEAEVTKELRIASLPSVTRYKLGSKLSFEGLKVSGFDCYDGVADNLSGQDFKNDELTFSIAEGTELKSEGKQVITISKDGYKQVSFQISVEKVVVVKALKVKSFPTKTRYVLKEGAVTKFDSTGLRVAIATYNDGVYKGEKILENEKFELSIKSGTQLVKEGNYSIEVTHKTDKDCLSDTFSIIVFTEDLSIYNLIKGMQESKNYQVEILNNVGTNNDATGFHYLRTFTEKYYEETEYQNVINSENGTIDFSTEKIKNQYGYMGYKHDATGEKSIIGYHYDALGSVEGTNIITTSSNNWWDKASSLTTLPTIFDLKHIPVETKNGKFLGSYGTTELKVTGFGNCSIPAVEEAIEYGSIQPNKTIDVGVAEIADKLRGDYMVRYNYGETGVDLSTPVTTFHKDYYYDSPNNLGYAKINGKVYEFKAVTDKNTKEIKLELTTGKPASDSILDVSKYVETLKEVRAVIYPKDGLKDVLGVKNTDDALSKNTLNTFSLYNAFSSPSDKCYQSFDDATKKAYENYLLGGEVLENGRIWLLTHYVDSITEVGKQEIEYVETWNINLTSGSGFVMPLGSFSEEEASLDWVEKGVAELEASGTLK